MARHDHTVYIILRPHLWMTGENQSQTHCKDTGDLGTSTILQTNVDAENQLFLEEDKEGTLPILYLAGSMLLDVTCGDGILCISK